MLFIQRDLPSPIIIIDYGSSPLNQQKLTSEPSNKMISLSHTYFPQLRDAIFFHVEVSGTFGRKISYMGYRGLYRMEMKVRT